MSLIPDTLFALTAIGVAVLAALSDAATGTVPNRLTVPVLVAAPLVHGLAQGPGAFGLSRAAARSCGAVPPRLLARGGMGGGDVRLFAALGALVGSDCGLRIELASLFVTLFYALALLAWRGTLIATLLRSLALLTRFGRTRDGTHPLDSAQATTV